MAERKSFNPMVILPPIVFATVLVFGFPTTTLVAFFKDLLLTFTVFGLLMMNHVFDPWVDEGRVGAPKSSAIGSEFIKKWLLCLMFAVFLVGLRVVSEGNYTVQGILSAGFGAMTGLAILSVIGAVTVLAMPDTSNSNFFVAGTVVGLIVLLVSDWRSVFDWKIWVPAPVVDLFIWSLKMIARLFIQSGQEVVSIISALA